MVQRQRSVAWVIAAGLVICLVGCRQKGGEQSSAPSGTPAGGATPQEQFAAGRKVFDANGCARCHTVGGGAPGVEVPGEGGPDGPVPGGGMKGRARGPDLATVGRDHTVDWLGEHVRDPRSHKPDSRMPPFGGKLKPDDLRALAEYLASLK